MYASLQSSDLMTNSRSHVSTENNMLQLLYYFPTFTIKSSIFERV